MTVDRASLSELQQMVHDFCDERDWKQFHTAKDCAISLSVEAGEVLEHFLWLKDGEQEEYVRTHKEAIADELGDVLYNILMLADETGIDVEEAFRRKLQKIGEKYPVEKSKGRKEKYTEL